MLVVTVAQPTYVSVSDVLGRKGVLYVAMVLFALGSIVFAIAETMSIVILGRAIQGIGGGGIDVLQVMILSEIITLKERSLYMGVNAVFNAFGNIAGLLVAWLGKFAHHWCHRLAHNILPPNKAFTRRLQDQASSAGLDWYDAFRSGCCRSESAPQLGWVSISLALLADNFSACPGLSVARRPGLL